MKTASEIARSIFGATVHGDPDVTIEGATHDSRQVRPGYLFAVLKGAHSDGRTFVEDAIERGARALLVEQILDADITQIEVDDVRSRLGAVAAACNGWPTEQLATVGITGTNGKTTTVYLTESSLSALGMRPGVMSTVEYRFGSSRWPATHTTPEATVIQSVAREMLEAGATHLIMEASSHGLAFGRLGGCRFRVVAFTNLSQDHLDFHRDMADYAAAKLTLFTSAIKGESAARAVVNADDPFAETIMKHLVHPVMTVSIDAASAADIRPAEPPSYGIDGVTSTITTPDGAFPLRSPLIGEHNLSNLLVALGICMQLGVAAEHACRSLGGPGAPGRLERVSYGEEFAVLVDYAHTPDALSRVLAALRPLTRGRLICVFGCGGDRDRAKRPLMGRAVRDGADLAVVTSDNPRTEDPGSVIEMIVPGIDGDDMREIDGALLGTESRGYVLEVDRRSAIGAAIGAARKGDTVLIAGKGHEDYQILGTGKIHFDDREEARAALARLRGGDRG